MLIDCGATHEGHIRLQAKWNPNQWATSGPDVQGAPFFKHNTSGELVACIHQYIIMVITQLFQEFRRIKPGQLDNWERRWAEALNRLARAIKLHMSKPTTDALKILATVNELEDENGIIIIIIIHT